MCIRDSHNVSLFTNGTLINENNYKTIAECCQEIQISVEGVTQEPYERIRGRGNYAKALHAIDLLKTTGIKDVYKRQDIACLQNISQNLW